MAEGTTILLTTQYLEEADRVCDIVVVDHGRIIAEGTPAELKANLGDIGRRASRCCDDDDVRARVPAPGRPLRPRARRRRTSSSHRGPRPAVAAEVLRSSTPPRSSSAGIVLREPASTTCSSSLTGTKRNEEEPTAASRANAVAPAETDGEDDA